MTNVFRQTRPVKGFTFIAAAPDFRLGKRMVKGTDHPSPIFQAHLLKR